MHNNDTTTRASSDAIEPTISTDAQPAKGRTYTMTIGGVGFRVRSNLKVGVSKARIPNP